MNDSLKMLALVCGLLVVLLFAVLHIDSVSDECAEKGGVAVRGVGLKVECVKACKL